MPITRFCALIGLPEARARLQPGLVAGEPDGETTLAWTVAQDLMHLSQRDPIALESRLQR